MAKTAIFWTWCHKVGIKQKIAYLMGDHLKRMGNLQKNRLQLFVINTDVTQGITKSVTIWDTKYYILCLDKVGIEKKRLHIWWETISKVFLQSHCKRKSSTESFNTTIIQLYLIQLLYKILYPLSRWLKERGK